MEIKLGRGVLTWSRSERVSDRYGTVYLIDDGHSSLTFDPSPSLVDQRVTDRLIGKRGRLFAHVVEARDSTHIGDLFRGVGPRRTNAGTALLLGTGRLFTEPAPDGGAQVGVSPDPDREPSDDPAWLDVRALYDAHEHLVDLAFVTLDA